MQIHTFENRRIIQHTDDHYDIEETRAVLAENGEIVGCEWAVIFCSEDEMARTLSGNLTGKAARLEREDKMSAALDRSPFTKKFEAAYTSLIDAMGDEFFVWYDSPEFEGLTNGQMLIVMQGKLASFVTEEDADTVHALIAAAESTEGFDVWADPQPQTAIDFWKNPDGSWKPFRSWTSYPRRFSEPLSAEEIDDNNVGQ